MPTQVGRVFDLHPTQAGGDDEVVKSARYDVTTGPIEVPARTVAGSSP